MVVSQLDDVPGMDIVSDAAVVFCKCSPIEDVSVVVFVVFWDSWTTGDVSVSDVDVVFCNGSPIEDVFVVVIADVFCAS